MKMTVNLCFFVLWLILGVIIVEGGPKKVKAKSGAELRVTKDYCSSNDECESKQCCPIPGREHHKMCYGSCENLRMLKQITQPNCVMKVFRNKNITYCITPLITWYHALRDCCRVGGQLPLVDDPDTLEVLSEMVINLKVSNQEGWMWTGLTTIKTSITSTERWTWYQPNSPEWNTSFWETIAPNNNFNGTGKSSQSCTTIGPHGPGDERYGLTDDGCGDMWGYACVSPLKTP